jgi:carboxyl-terminal processing protease
MRPHIKELLEFSMERSFIKIQSVKDAQILSGNIGYIRITQFQQNTAEDCKKIFEKLLPQATQGLIIDVRNNPGGLLKEASDCISYFIEAPKLIVSTKGRLSDQNDELRSKNKSAVKDLPLVVLINKGSASGAEILAGAVKDWHRGILVGTNTFGKGSVQTVLPLRDGSALKLTTAEYFTPKGININDIGIKPDIEVQMTEEAEDKLWKFRSTKENKSDAVLDLSIDPQLQRAIDILKGLSVYSEITSNETANKT